MKVSKIFEISKFLLISPPYLVVPLLAHEEKVIRNRAMQRLTHSRGKSLAGWTVQEVDILQIDFCPILIPLLPPHPVLNISLEKLQKPCLACNNFFYHLNISLLGTISS